MSLDLQHQMGALTMAPVVRLFTFQFTINIPVNPLEIVQIEGDEFSINMNNMVPLQPYLIESSDFRYMIWKNENDALVMTEA